jgi:hypothetical protein
MRTLLAFSAQQITGGEVFEAEVLDQLGAHGALARARTAKHEDHERLLVGAAFRRHGDGAEREGDTAACLRWVQASR